MIPGGLRNFIEKHQFLAWMLTTVFLAILIAVDPLGLGPLGRFDYRPMKHTIASYDQVMSKWPWDAGSRLRFATLHSKGEVNGPESLEFDADGQGPYTGLADGRVVRWSDERNRWELFALPSTRWNESCISDNSTKKSRPRDEELCGRPLGLRFSKLDQKLYFADSYYGLEVVGTEGGIAEVLSQEVGGEPIKFANDLDIYTNGSIFFTDSSARHTRLHHHRILLESEDSGRLLRYDPVTKETVVVLNGLSFPNGVQLSQDESFLLITETTNCRVLRYWLEGPSKGTLEVFADLPGFPDNVRINSKGQFWVAIDCCRTRIQEVFSTRPWLRLVFFKLPVPIKFLYKMVGMRMFTMIALFDSHGTLIDTLEDRDGQVVKLVSEVQQREHTLWIGSVYHKQIATIPYPG